MVIYRPIIFESFNAKETEVKVFPNPVGREIEYILLSALTLAAISVTSIYAFVLLYLEYHFSSYLQEKYQLYYLV